MPDLEARVALLENRLEDQTRMLQELRADMSALRTAHSADTAMLLGAIRDLREEMTHRFEQIDGRFQQIDGQFTHIDSQFTHVNSQFTHVDSQFTHVNGRFTQIEGRFLQIEARFQHVDEKIDRHFALLVGIQVATVSAFVSALVALYFR